MKSKLARFLDNFIFTVIVWLFSAIITLYFVRETYLIILIATTIALSIGFFANFKRKKNQEKEERLYLAEIAAQHFLFRDDYYALDYFYNALRSRYETTKNRFFLTINKTVIAPCVTEPLSLKKAVFFYCEALRKGAETLVILSFKSEKFSVNIKEKLVDLRLEIFGAEKTYRLLKSLNALPKQEKLLKSRKIKGFLAQAFSSKRTKSYLGATMVMLFGAYFSFYSIYYLAVAAICLTLALLCKLDITKKIRTEN